VTTFFRDPEMFAALARWLPTRVAEIPRGGSLRVWVPGCASGEEAYSTAILLLESLGPRLADLEVQVFATDADERATRAARTGIYPRDSLYSVSEDLRARFFVDVRDQVRVSKEVRDLCVFATHDLLRQPPFRNMDIVSCRNVLFCFQRDVRNDVLTKLHYALKARGCLVLGQAETVEPSSHLFDCLDAHGKLFARTPGPTPRLSEAVELGRCQGTAAPTGPGVALPPPSALQAAIDTVYAPPAAVVDARGTVLHVSGAADRYMRQPQGKGEFDIGHLSHPAPRGEINTLFHLLAMRPDTEVISPAVTCEIAGKAAHVRVVGRKLDDPQSGNRLGEEMSRGLLREMLTAAGASLVCVEAGTRVVEQLSVDGADAFHVVLCDIEMPELDGYGAIIGLTAHAFEQARDRGRSAGMTCNLTKPYSLKALTEVIARHLPT
jgi:two-component system CheB/CheR fusion protein